jgi:hypothetical protein
MPDAAPTRSLRLRLLGGAAPPSFGQLHRCPIAGEVVLIPCL